LETAIGIKTCEGDDLRAGIFRVAVDVPGSNPTSDDPNPYLLHCVARVPSHSNCPLPMRGIINRDFRMRDGLVRKGMGRQGNRMMRGAMAG
jgi:hypothetical protein